MKSPAVLATLALLSLTTLADMGSIPLKSGVRILEPKQDAIIAWNGKEQLLYLKTTLSASEDTKVLEVMPLPSKPTVDASDSGVFKRCSFLLPKISAKGGTGGPFGPAAPNAVKGGKVVETKEIGAHNIKIVELLDANKFQDWVRDEFSDAATKVEIPQELLETIGDYATDGYRWFLFDTIDLTKTKIVKTPLRIKFKTDKLYYPMRITRTESGDTEVALSILTNVLFEEEDCVGIPRSEIRVPAKPITIAGDKLGWIDPPIARLLGTPKSARLRTWIISGKIDEFEEDLLIAHPDARDSKKKSRIKPRS